MNALRVKSQVGSRLVRFVAQLTREGFLAGVPPHVLLEVVGLLYPLAADRALERLDGGMNPHVPRQISRLVEAPAARGADEPPLVGVDAPVPHDLRARLEALAARLADVRPIVGVHEPVQLERMLEDEHLTAELAPERHVIGEVTQRHRRSAAADVRASDVFVAHRTPRSQRAGVSAYRVQTECQLRRETQGTERTTQRLDVRAAVRSVGGVTMLMFDEALGTSESSAAVGTRVRLVGVEMRSSVLPQRGQTLEFLFAYVACVRLLFTFDVRSCRQVVTFAIQRCVVYNRIFTVL